MSDYTHEIVQAIGSLSSEMTETRFQLRQALQDISDVLNVPAPKRVRNEAAVCGNCPYACVGVVDDAIYYCRKNSAVADVRGQYGFPHEGWCGDHPDFWKEA